MNVRNDLVRIIDDLLGDDPRLALIACARLTNDEIPWLEQRAVSLARRNGWNWAKIGRLLRRTRQSVRQRFDNATLAMRPDPHLLRHRQAAEFAGIHEEIRRSAACDGSGDGDDPIAW